MRRTPKAWVAAAVLVMLALAGCGRVTTDITVHEDGSYDLTAVLAASEAELKAAGQTPESFTALLTEQLTSQPGAEHLTITDYREDGYAGVEITGERISGDDLGMFGRGVVTTDADGVHFQLRYPITALTSSFTPEQAAAVEIRTTVTLPSAVTDHNGTLVDESTVEWVGDGSTDLDYAASSAPVGGAAADDPQPAAGWLLPLGVALAALMLAGVGGWLVLRNPRKDAAGGPGSTGP